MREAKESIREATDVYKAMAQDSKNKVPKSVLDNAKCIAIFPDAVTVSLGIGGSHSDGVAFCKSSTGAWQNPMFLDLVGGSIGVQAGVKSADVVMYITGDKARADLENGKFTVGGELSAVAGTFDVVMANPPYMMDPLARSYRNGGAAHGAALSLRMLEASLPRLNVGGRLLLYTGSAIVAGRDDFIDRAGRIAVDAGLRFRYEEIDPDVFGEELEAANYADVERIAAVGLVVNAD